MTRRITPITVFCKDIPAALYAAKHDRDSRAMIGGPGTLSFHALLAQHGAGEFTTLYVPVALKGKFAPPVGGILKEDLA